MIREFIKNHYKILEIILIFLFSLTPLLWLKDGQIILGHDSGFRLDPIQHLINLFYSWDPSFNFGTDWSLLKGFLITQAPEALFISLTRSFTVGQQLTFIFWFFLMGISMYIFINSFFYDKKYWIFRIFGGSFYMYNFFILQGWFIAERAKFSLFAVIPLGVLLIYKTLTKEYSILKGVILFSLISFLLNAGGNPTFYGALILIYGLTFIYLTSANVYRKGRREIIYSFKLGFFFIIGFLAINAYFILPQIYLLFNNYRSNLLAVGGIEGIIGWEEVINRSASFINLFRLQGIPDWYNNDFHSYAFQFIKNPFLIAFSFVFFFILLFGLLNHQQLPIEKRNNKLIFLIFLFLLFGLPFTAGSHPPFGSIYILFIKYIPGFAIFRSAFYKFGEILWFSYIFLVGFYLNLLLLKFVKRRNLYILLGVFSFSFLLAYHFPFFEGNFFTWNKPFTTKVKVPSYVNEMADYINKLPNDTRILLLPKIDDQINADSYRWGFWSLDSLPILFTNKSVVSKTIHNQDIISAIYEAIDKNDEQLFFQLANLAGINKILWRDDILYTDKKTSISSFSRTKNNLENFREVLPEKQEGAWKMYAIRSSGYVPFFYAPENFIYSYSRTLSTWEIFNRKYMEMKPAIVFTNKEKKKDNLASFYNATTVEADCILCKPNEIRDLESQVKIPYSKFLPNSPFYFFVSFKEDKTRDLYKNLPLQRIHFDISTAGKRIAEIIQFMGRDFDQDTPEELIIDTIENYKLLIEDAVQQSNLLREDIKNSALIQLLSYLNVHQAVVAGTTNKRGLAETELEEMSNFMQEYISSFLDGKIWKTNPYRDRIAYMVNIESAGDYDLIIKNAAIFPTKIQIDGKEVPAPFNVYLNAGVHKISLVYPGPDNLIKTDEKQNGNYDLGLNGSAQFDIRNLKENETYIISFDYKVIDGKLNFAIVENGRIGKGRIIKMDTNIWNKFGYVYKPTKGTTFASLRFFPSNYQFQGAMFQLKNFMMIKSFTPLVFLSKTVSVKNRNTPTIDFQRINPTKYIVKVENAVEPYVLSFQDAYNEGWKASIADSRNYYNNSVLSGIFLKPLSEKDHLETNGYANGWFIKQKGDYAIVVEYYPQKIFYIGLFVSIITIFSFSILYKFKRHEKNY